MHCTVHKRKTHMHKWLYSLTNGIQTETEADRHGDRQMMGQTGRQWDRDRDWDRQGESGTEIETDRQTVG